MVFNTEFTTRKFTTHIVLQKNGVSLGALVRMEERVDWDARKKTLKEWERKLEVREGVVSEKEVQVAEKLKMALNPWEDAILKTQEEERKIVEEKKKRLFELYDENWLQLVNSRIMKATPIVSPTKSNSSRESEEGIEADGSGEKDISFHADDDEVAALEEDAAAPVAAASALVAAFPVAAEERMEGIGAVGRTVIESGGGSQGEEATRLLTDQEMAEEEDKGKVGVLLQMLHQSKLDAKCKVDLTELVQPYLESLVRALRSGDDFFSIWEHIGELKDKLRICSSCLHSESAKRKLHLDPKCREMCCNTRRCNICLHAFSGKACSCNCAHTRKFLKLVKEWAKSQA